MVQRSAVLPDARDDLLQFDWLAGVIDRRLKRLQQFVFSLRLVNAEQMDESALNEFLSQIERRFVHGFPPGRHFRLSVKRV